MPSTLRLMLMTLSVILFSFATSFGQTATAYTMDGLPNPTVTSDKPDYAPGEVAHITGTGWVKDNNVHVEFREDPDYPDFHIYDIQIDGEGNWSIDYPIEERHLGVKFTVVSRGKETGTIVYYNFTDGNSALAVPDASGSSGGAITLYATLTQSGSNGGLLPNSGIPGKTISFSLNGTSVGSATTDAFGLATLNTTIPVSITPGNYPNGILATFAGDVSATASSSIGYTSSSKTAKLTVTAPTCTTPTITAINSCIGGGSVTFTQTGGTTGGTWSVNGGGTINSSSGVFTATTAGSFNVSYTVGTCSDTKSFIVFPSAPTITAPANTCASAFTLPSVPAVSGFTVQYSIDGGGYAASPTVPTTTGSHTVKARYVFTSGSVAAPAACAESNQVSTIIFPSAPTITAPDNTCASAFTLPTVASVTDFTVQYSIDGGGYAASPTVPTTTGSHTVKARYVFTSGSVAAPTACAESNQVSTIIFPSAPTITAPDNTCASAFTLPTVASVTDFTVQYSIDGGGYAASPTVPTTTGSHTVKARYVFTDGLVAAPSACAESNQVSVIVFPSAPTITSPANTCASAFSLPTVSGVTGFTVQYSIDGGAYAAAADLTVPSTTGSHTVKARYVFTDGLVAAPSACAESNQVSVIVFPSAPTITSPANTCASAFSLPTVSGVTGFTVQYSIDGGAYAAAADLTVPSTTGSHTVKARYVFTDGLVAAPSACAESNQVSVIVFPSAPTITSPANTCASAFSLPTVSGVTGFTVQYSIDGGAYAAAADLTVPSTTGSHTVKARYVFTDGLVAAPSACAESNQVSVIVFPSAPTITSPANTCASAFSLPTVSGVTGFTVQYSIDGGAYAAAADLTVPSTTGSHTVKARYVFTDGLVAAPSACAESNQVSVIVFPSAPTITSPANTCASAFSLPTVSGVTGFTVQYSIDGGAYAAAADLTVPSTTGSHTVKARYVFTDGLVAAPSACAESNQVSVIVFPSAPTITSPANTCASAFSLPTVSGVTGFTVQYSIDGGAYAAAADLTVPSTTGSHTVKARYVFTDGLVAAPSACAESNQVSVIVFPSAPTITSPANTCASAFSLPTVSGVTGFTVQYSIDGGAYAAAADLTVPSTTGSHTVKARYVFTDGLVAAPSACAESNQVSVIVFPSAPTITSPANTCASAFSLPTVSGVTGFTVQYSIDGGAYAAAADLTVPSTTGSHTVKARYVFTDGLVAAPSACAESNQVSVIVFPSAPTITSPANTCASAFSLPTVSGVTGFTVQYSIDGGAYAAAADLTVPSTTGSHTVKARYVFTDGLVAAPSACAESNQVSVIVFPSAPTITSPANTCASAFSLPTVSGVTGFTVQYSIDGGAYAAAADLTVPSTTGSHTVKARYVFTDGLVAAPSACAESNQVSVIVFPSAPTITSPANTCASAFSLPTVSGVTGFTVQYSIDGGAYAAAADLTVPSTTGSHTVKARYVFTDGLVAAPSACAESNQVSVIVFPSAPTITSPANTCASAFSLPTVSGVTGFTVQYSIDGGAYAAAADLTVPSTTGSHTVKARYVFTDGLVAAPSACAESNQVSVIVFPSAPTITSPANTCASAFSLPTVSGVTGFTVQYSIDGGAYAAAADLTVPSTTGSHTVKARYVFTDGLVAAPSACAESNQVSVIVFPSAPTITSPANTCASAFSLPTVSGVTGFTVQYSIDGGAYAAAADLTVPSTTGSHTVKARYVFTDGLVAAPSACAESNQVSVIVFPSAPTITSPANTCASAFSLPTVSGVTGFTVQYSIDGGAYAAAADLTVPSTTGSHTVKARYVFTDGLVAAPSACAESNQVSVIVFPSAPTITSPANTCASAFSLPTVSGVTGFTVQYSIDGGAYAAAADLTVPSTTGSHTVKARYVFTDGLVAAPSACAESNQVSVIVFPSAPTITSPANTCASAFSLPTVSGVTGFTVQYSIDGGAYAAAADLTVPSTTGSHTVKARYVFTDGLVAAPSACAESNQVSVIVFPSAPTITSPANTCASAFSLPTVSGVTGFTVQYSIDGGAYAAAADLTVPSTTGSHTVKARYVFTDGLVAAPSACAESNQVSVIVFPSAPTITSPANTCASAFSLPTVSGVTGFTVQYSIDGGAYAAAADLTVPSTTGSHTVKARYVFTDGLVAAPSACAESNQVSVIVFPSAPTITSPANTCASAFSLPTVSGVTGFTVQYSIDGGAYAAAADLTVPSTTGSHTVKARYVFTDGLVAAPSACAESNQVSVIVFPSAPTITSPANTCASAFSLPTVSGVTGFTVQYSIDGGAYAAAADLTVPSTTGSHTVKARYVFTDGLVAAPSACAESNQVSTIIFPSAPTITAPANTCASAFTLPTVASVTDFTVQYSIDGGGYAASPTVPTTTGSHTVKARYVFTSGSVAAPAACAESNEVSTIIYALPVITLSSTSGSTQYSDAPPILTIGVSDSDGPGTLTVSTSYINPSNAVLTGLPTGLSITWTGSGLIKSGTLTGTALANAGVYTITISANDGYCNSSTVYVLTINRETVCAEYNGNLSVSAVTLNKSSSAKATITMSVGLNEDDVSGNITNATVKFKLDGYSLPGADASGWVTVPVKSLNSPLNTQGNASLIADVQFTGSYNSYTFYYQISGNYVQSGSCGDQGQAVINVYVPQNEFITGGGYIRPNSSVGVFPAEAGRKANFGFNVKYNSKMTNLQGNINYIFRRMEADNIVHVYQVKGNAMTSLVVNGNSNPKTAVFIGKCNVADVTVTTDPNFVNYLYLYGGTGNSTMQVEVTDAGEPGTSDQYAITVWNGKGDVFHSSNWLSTKTVKQTLSGGNIQVGTASSTTSSRIDNTLTKANQDYILVPLTVKALPNPTSSYFNVQIQSDNVKDAVQLKVYDLFGRQIEMKNNVAPNSSVQLGGNYIPGVYMVDIIQGDKRQQLKLIKQ